MAAGRRKSLVAQAATALEEEGKRTISGRAPYAGEATPGALSRLEALRDAQLLLQSERHMLLTTIRQVKDRGDGLSAPLSQLEDALARDAADLHNMALRAFEVSLTASSGFWITLGLLASWSIRRPSTPHRRAHDTSP